MERSQTTFGLVYIKNLILTSTLSYLQILEHFPQTIVCAYRHENNNSAPPVVNMNVTSSEAGRLEENEAVKKGRRTCSVN